MAKTKSAQKKANKANEYHCLKIVESFIEGKKDSAKKHINKLVENHFKESIEKAIDKNIRIL